MRFSCLLHEVMNGGEDKSWGGDEGWVEETAVSWETGHAKDNVTIENIDV